MAETKKEEKKAEEVFVNEFARREGESQAEYNERVPVAIQPVQPAPTTNYLGQPL